MSMSPTPEENAELKKLVKDLTEKLVDDGRLIEAGWVGFKVACGLKNASALQQNEMRKAFFAGSLHLFTSVLSFLEPGQEATDKDMLRMSLVFEELERFQKEYENLHPRKT